MRIRRRAQAPFPSFSFFLVLLPERLCYNSEMDKANAVLDRFLEPVQQSLTPEQARMLVNFHADDATQERIDELARKANEGTLTNKERVEYEGYVEAGDLIALLQAKACAILAQSES